MRRDTLKITVPSKQDPTWLQLRFPKSVTYVSLLKSIKPFTYRKWNPTDRCWEVHIKRLVMAVSLGLRVFSHADWSDLPGPIQVELVKGLENKRDYRRIPDDTNKSASNSSPYKVLWLIEGAPWIAVKAVYRALSMKYHPDTKNGNEKQFKRINKAYEEIRENTQQ